MAMLRSELTCPVFGSGSDLPLNVLPTCEDVLRCVLWVHHSKKQQFKDTYEEISVKLEDIWNRASIPIIDHRSITRRSRTYYNKYYSLVNKSSKSRKNITAYRQKFQHFKEKNPFLFDIATCRCTSFDLCSCEKKRKIPIKEQKFLLNQRTDRKMMIGGLDRDATKKTMNLLTRKRHHDEFECKNKLTDAIPSCSLNFRLS